MKSARLVPVFLLVLFIGLAPFGNALYTSFFSDVYGRREFVGLNNFRFLLSDPAFLYSLNITVLWAAASTLISLFLGYLFAVVITRKGGFSKILYAGLLVPWGIPVYIAVPLWRALIYGNGGESLVSALFGFRIDLMTSGPAGFLSALFVSVWLTVPLTAFVLSGAVKKVPRSAVEAAHLDGAGLGETIRHILFPMTKNTVLVMAVLNFIKALKEFTVIFLMTDGGPPLIAGITENHIVGATTTLGVFLYEIFSETSDFGISSAYSVIMLGIIVLSLVLWFFSKKEKKRLVPLIVFAAAVQPLFMGFPGFIVSGIFLLTLIRKRFFFAAAAGHILFTVIMIATRGFLAGFQPTVIVSAAGLMLLKRETGRDRRFPRAPLLSAAPRVLAAALVVSSAAAAVFLLIVSFSKLDSLTVSAAQFSYLTAANYGRIFAEENIGRYMLNTLLLSGITAAAIPLFTFPAAAYLALQRRRKGSAFFLSGVQVLGLAGGMHTLIPLYSMFIRINLINSYVPLVLIYLYHAVPVSLFTTYAYLERFPKSLNDLAEIEGAGPLRYMLQVLLPVSLPVIAASCMVAFLGAWNGFMAPLLFLNEESKYTISVKLFSLVGNLGSANPKWNLFAAASAVNIAVIGLIFYRFRKPLASTPLEEVEE
ncbi:MAG: ABC transporter permease subunit [Spirochaetia bacterium]